MGIHMPEALEEVPGAEVWEYWGSLRAKHLINFARGAESGAVWGALLPQKGQRRSRTPWGRGSGEQLLGGEVLGSKN